MGTECKEMRDGQGNLVGGSSLTSGRNRGREKADPRRDELTSPAPHRRKTRQLGRQRTLGKRQCQPEVFHRDSMGRGDLAGECSPEMWNSSCLHRLSTAGNKNLDFAEATG